MRVDMVSSKKFQKLWGIWQLIFGVNHNWCWPDSRQSKQGLAARMVLLFIF
jgi:hypothetical protein